MICTLVNPKGGSGKSTLLFNLAVRFAQDNYDVQVIDMDIQESIRSFLADRSAAGLPPPFRYNAVHSMPAADMGPMVEELAANAELTFIDTPARYTEETWVALALSKLALVPMRPTRADYTALGQIIRRLPMQENPDLALHLVLSQVRFHRFLDAAEVYSTLVDSEVPYITLSNIIIGNRVYWERTSLGKAVLEQDPVSLEAVAELEELYSFTRKRLLI